MYPLMRVWHPSSNSQFRRRDLSEINRIIRDALHQQPKLFLTQAKWASSEARRSSQITGDFRKASEASPFDPRRSDQ